MNVEALVLVLVLAAFLGFELIRKVPGNLHTPLMSGSNAISGITLVGAIVATAAAVRTGSGLAAFLGALAIGCAAVNVVGGYLVTDRMLRMFGGPTKRPGDRAAGGRP